MRRMRERLREAKRKRRVRGRIGGIKTTII